MARSFLTAGAQLVLVTPRPSPLRNLAGQPGVVASFESAAISEADLSTAVDTFTGPGVVLIDDAEMTKDCEAGEQLAEIVTFGADQQRAVVCARQPRCPVHRLRHLAAGRKESTARAAAVPARLHRR